VVNCSRNTKRHMLSITLASLHPQIQQTHETNVEITVARAWYIRARRARLIAQNAPTFHALRCARADACVWDIKRHISFAMRAFTSSLSFRQISGIFAALFAALSKSNQIYGAPIDPRASADPSCGIIISAEMVTSHFSNKDWSSVFTFVYYPAAARNHAEDIGVISTEWNQRDTTPEALNAFDSKRTIDANLTRCLD